MSVVDDILQGPDISIINLIDALLLEAIGCHASDIHIDPTEFCVRVRFRIDGMLEERYQLQSILHAEIISRIKVLCALRTDEHQATKDGRFHFRLSQSERAVDIRVSIVPTYFGENAVLRILLNTKDDFTLEKLGFTPSDREKIKTAMSRPSGMILVTGPTGSGKSTTLYTLINMLNHESMSIVTIEDPIEYSVPDITQIQVNPHAGLSFANGLRSILRQGPNIIMVGEIRDSETAAIAINSALTGHLLLTTLHTSDSATTLPRLVDMGVDGYLVASTVSVAIAQRLVRKICEACRKKSTSSENSFIGTGCTACKGTGYLGRMSINEVLVADEAIREAILQRASANDIRKLAIERGMTTMFQDGFLKVRQGMTTPEEVLRVINE